MSLKTEQFHYSHALWFEPAGANNKDRQPLPLVNFEWDPKRAITPDFYSSLQLKMVRPSWSPFATCLSPCPSDKTIWASQMLRDLRSFPHLFAPQSGRAAHSKDCSDILFLGPWTASPASSVIFDPRPLKCDISTLIFLGIHFPTRFPPLSPPGLVTLGKEEGSGRMARQRLRFIDSVILILGQPFELLEVDLERGNSRDELADTEENDQEERGKEVAVEVALRVENLSRTMSQGEGESEVEMIPE